MEMTFKEMLNAIDGEVIVQKEEANFNKLCIDTRKVEKDNVFLAIKGANFNGNDFAIKALESGASVAIIDEVKFDEQDAQGKGTIIKVKNTREALLNLAKFYREKLGLKVVGVTGSTGKTSTKDLIAALLSDKYKVFKTKGNFNNDIGLPLMILELTSDYDVAVLEMGMSSLGEIELLASVARPDIGVITNIGLSHIENLKTQENILKAKMEISTFFNKENVLIVNGEDKLLQNISSNVFKVKKIGYNHEYDVYASNIILREEETEFLAHAFGEEAVFNLPMAGKHNVLNTMLAIEVSECLGVSFKQMVKGLENLEATSMRLQVVKKQGLTIINDCYNASPDSMKSSLDVLSAYKNGRRVAILGDMYELGDESEKAHYEVGKYAKDKVDTLIVIGGYIKNFKDGFDSDNIIMYNTKEECIKELENIVKLDDVVLIKASRGVKLEDVVKKLEEM
ncbi:MULTISPECIES: UDP-N-acetylmuramoyl-tripeptide--D-alanyl-D-alanine ligase [unclassified Clostridium]|uniref:UDP-N-acetylmuramoyl-tripeptide--D-alanyl-D- alanine ligase n=1 Tax=Clostridium TaxID=1485 RepID=UPI001C8C57FA|nr:MULTISPECIES: UDP-N-acetylmuramoyl-tripeptide--D-alanyl-D-alanine ligase [unclassified Clostridium]MBX9135994.1 UDP-N-acetylmuramoyl-tripeptide--D-alanyl-D-alanine ligase [Clostridium sp. K12(2020)]MBX9142724.1 UDP-N-acetylmuramoyl-tripeptide--D-alanyl-D-alanine ligase [Clostridium sp. K13]MDU2290517.1 UDP-N-acetylmuramoyl-tripeptide--D-alanyl-D-alanine ligase [Clostridium celatum]MDU4326564.1 UDP-N-acetylmuramoyl-tripeptide--D-alanyl-D-alanine ligase [Clostridium celatum]